MSRAELKILASAVPCRRAADSRPSPIRIHGRLPAPPRSRKGIHGRSIRLPRPVNAIHGRSNPPDGRIRDRFERAIALMARKHGIHGRLKVPWAADSRDPWTFKSAAAADSRHPWTFERYRSPIACVELVNHDEAARL